ncbi:unnamed protein product [Moneuplotes crassus]|uniref:Uncharacterized protein n=1 Tax=Euplotes crassus TaxID=5936 RepID=A0AAD1XE55_EUPCR|nr:unnamed protein product [Moneuplotes crassus]
MDSLRFIRRVKFLLCNSSVEGVCCINGQYRNFTRKILLNVIHSVLHSRNFMNNKASLGYNRLCMPYNLFNTKLETNKILSLLKPSLKNMNLSQLMR